MSGPNAPTRLNARPLVAGLFALPDDPMILSIVSALPGWWAVWADDTGEVMDPIACWALVEVRDETPARRYVQAMTSHGDGTASLAFAIDGYVGVRYFAPGAEPMRRWSSEKAE